MRQHSGKKRLGAVLLSLALCLSLLPTAALAVDTSHDISTGTLTITQDGSYTVTGTTNSNRIVVGENVTATVTLNGVDITGTGNDSYGTSTPVTSPIDLSAGATLTLILGDKSTNTLTGGAGGGNDGAPGIHVPDSAALIVQGSGSLTVTGGSSMHSYGGAGIGGKSNSNSAYASGENCGTVIILSTGRVEVKGGSEPGGTTAGDIGGGGYHPGGNGQGIRPSGSNTYTVWGSLTLPCDVTIPDGATVTIPGYTSLTVPEGATLTNNGTIVKDYFGSFINNGTVTGQRPDDDRYSIDYENEVIGINNGYEYEVYTAATGGTQLGVIDIITDYIGQSFYIQQAGSSERIEIKIPARPAAPSISTTSVDYENETFTITLTSESSETL